MKKLKLYIGEIYVIDEIHTKLNNPWVIKKECNGTFYKKGLVYQINKKYMRDFITGEKYRIGKPALEHAKIGQAYVNLPLHFHEELNLDYKKTILKKLRELILLNNKQKTKQLKRNR